MPTRRTAVILAAACYVLVFNSTYRDLISPIFSFFGMGYRPISFEHFWTTVVLCIIPSVWMPITFSRPTLLLFYMQYLIIFVPGSFLVFHSVRPELSHEFAMQIVWAMFLGLSIIELCYFVPVRAFDLPRLTPTAFWSSIGVASGIMLGYLVIKLSGNFRLVSFEEVSTVRYAMGDILATSGSRFGLYSQYLLLSLFLPIVFALGIFSKRWWLVIVVDCCYVFIFGIGGAKQAILAILYLPLVFVLVSRPKRQVALVLIMALTALLLSGYVTSAIFSTKINVALLSVVHFRFFTVPAMTIGQYADFFQTHPLTHWGNVTGFNLLLQNPYDSDIPYTIGRYYYHGLLGANSGLWASDGLAGFGLWGIPMISAVCALVFLLIDVMSARLDSSFVGVMLAYSAVSFTNVSLFTTLVTDGMGFMIFVLALAPRDEHGHIPLPRFPSVRKMHHVVRT